MPLDYGRKLGTLKKIHQTRGERGPQTAGGSGIRTSCWSEAKVMLSHPYWYWRPVYRDPKAAPSNGGDYEVADGSIMCSYAALAAILLQKGKTFFLFWKCKWLHCAVYAVVCSDSLNLSKNSYTEQHNTVVKCEIRFKFEFKGPTRCPSRSRSASRTVGGQRGRL